MSDNLTDSTKLSADTKKLSTDTKKLSAPAKLAMAGAAVFGLLYTSFGVLWLTVPEKIAQALGASLLSGSGLSTQIGDSAAFFLCAGAFMLLGVYKRSATLLSAGAWLIGLVAPARIVAWQAHGAALTLEPIIVEMITFIVVLGAARSLKASR